MDKISPEFSEEYLNTLIDDSEIPDLTSERIYYLQKVMFSKEICKKRVVLDSRRDIIKESANNYYKNVTQSEAENFYKDLSERNRSKHPNGSEPLWGLNSRLEKNHSGSISERVWHANGEYGGAIQEIIICLEKAALYAENKKQKKSLLLLIEFYKSGDLSLFDQYSIEWVSELESDIDYINGFIEVYGDSLGIKGSWESIVHIKDKKASKRTDIISANANWFERNSPTDSRFKKDNVEGVSASVVQSVILGGDCYPATPIGINLPNAEWIRETYGSKSVTIDNITEAYHYASLNNNFLEEYAYSQEEIERAREFGYIGGNLHTDLHECLGHGSGKVLPGVGTDALKNHYSTIEETRADLFALYFIADSKMIDIELFSSNEVGKAEYDAYIRNGLITQLVRVEKGQDIEESHMRNRQLIAKWAYELGGGDVIKRVVKDNKSYFVITDYDRLREIFGEQLKEIQRVKSEGDFERAAYLIETYGVTVDSELHQEVLQRYKKLNLAPYSGFVNPTYTLVREGGRVVDVMVEYNQSYTEQMLIYSDRYSFL